LHVHRGIRSFPQSASIRTEKLPRESERERKRERERRGRDATLLFYFSLSLSSNALDHEPHVIMASEKERKYILIFTKIMKIKTS